MCVGDRENPELPGRRTSRTARAIYELRAMEIQLTPADENASEARGAGAAGTAC